MLPAKTSQSRRLLDYLRHVSARTRESICRGLNDVSRPAIDKMLEEEIARGNISKNAAGYRLTGVALKLYDIEADQASVYVDRFKPLSKANYISTKGTRPGSDWSHDAYKSRQN